MSAREQWRVMLMAVDVLSEDELKDLRTYLAPWDPEFDVDVPREWQVVRITVEAEGSGEAGRRAGAIIHEALPARTHLDPEVHDVLPLSMVQRDPSEPT